MWPPPSAPSPLSSPFRPRPARLQGDFTYQHYTETGISQTSALVDPQSRECITLPEVQDETTAPAHSPRNNTDATATVFAGADCEGPYFTLRPHGGHASERLLVRSVVFS